MMTDTQYREVALRLQRERDATEYLLNRAKDWEYADLRNKLARAQLRLDTHRELYAKLVSQ